MISRRRLLLRIVGILPMLWVVATITFVVVHAAPGTYADQLDHPRLTEEARQVIRAKYGLDQPWHVQYFRWLGNVLRGDFGVSFHFKRPVKALILQAIWPTLLLAGTALVIDIGLGILIAVLSVRRPRAWLDRVLSVSTLALYGIPSFWLAGLAILVFSLRLDWLPPSHMFAVGADTLPLPARIIDLTKHLVLPAGCLGLAGAAATARYLRAAMLDVLESPYILAARTRGLSENRILWIHTLRPSLLPVVTLLGLSLPFLVSGSVVIETIFSWPGMGRLLIGAAHARDVPVIMAISMLGALAVMLGNLVADVLYVIVDPRARTAT